MIDTFTSFLEGQYYHIKLNGSQKRWWAITIFKVFLVKQKVEPNWIFLELHVKSFPGSQQFCEAASGDLLERMRDPAAGLQNPSANHHQHHHHQQHHNYCYSIIRSQLNGTLREHGSVDPPLNSWHLVTLNCHATAKTRFLLVGTTLLTGAPILGKLDQHHPQSICVICFKNIIIVPALNILFGQNRNVSQTRFSPSQLFYIFDFTRIYTFSR